MLHNMSNETPLIISRASGWMSMTKFNSPSPLQSLVRATALPLVLLAAGALPAFAGSVSVTGANGRNSWFGKRGRCGRLGSPRDDPHRAIRRTPPRRPAAMAARTVMAVQPQVVSRVARAAPAARLTRSRPRCSRQAWRQLKQVRLHSAAAAAKAALAWRPRQVRAASAGPAFSSATASSAMGPASAAANATGGIHGQGRPPLGVGGTASAIAAASSEGGVQVQADASRAMCRPTRPRTGDP